MNSILTLMALTAAADAQEQARSEPGKVSGAPDRSFLDWPSFPTVLRVEKPRYACPKCGATADTPKRCKPCSVKMRRNRR